MALVSKFEKISLERNRVHDDATATYTVFTGSDGKRYLQLDTYGTQSRKMRGKKSQSVQFEPEGISALKTILASEV
jgi:hypothetical protein